jgi:RNA polymerase sigma-70 factor (ECF subfamily)
VDGAGRARARAGRDQLIDPALRRAPSGDRESALLEAAKRGEEAAFRELVSPHERPLHLHCYRLLGSLHDADEALQETLLNAWRGIPKYEPRARLSAWLYRIATNVALRMIERRDDPPDPIDLHLQPYPDALLEGVAGPRGDPEAEAILAEGVGLAVVAAIQLLPPRQRVVLVLRDVLGWRAREVAELLGTTVPAANSALQRARETIAREHRLGTLARRHAPAGGAAEERVVRRFREAWAAVDVPGIVALLTDDALLTMPPVAMRLTGTGPIGEFFATRPAGGRLDRIELVDARVNRQPAVVSYSHEDGSGVGRAYGVMVLAIEGRRISGLTGFPWDLDLFERLGLPLTRGSAGDERRPSPGP